MKNRFAFMVILVTILSGINFPLDAQTAATTKPDRLIIPRPRPLAPEFDLLTERSIFIKGRQFVSSGADGSETHSGAPAKAEDTQIFNGVTDTDHELVAYVEDTVSGKVNQYKVGDSIAKGKIVDINLDSLDYESGGKTTQVYVGQNLSGVDMTGGATTSSEPTGPLNPIIERLRQRRLQETGGR